MKITKSEQNLAAASEILGNLRGDADAVLPHNPVVTWDGDLLRLTSDLIPLYDGEEVVVEYDEVGFGSGWDDAEAVAGDVVDFLNQM